MPTQDVPKPQFDSAAPSTDGSHDVVYLRYSLFLPPPLRLMRAFPTAIEINSDDRSEYLHRSRALALYNRVNRWLLFRNAKGFACVTPELTLHIPPAHSQATRICVTNGISLTEGAPLPPTKNERPRLIFLAGAPEPWHGLDKISWLAKELPEFDFDLVGPLWSTDAPAPGNVRIHGFLERDAYEPILARADVGLAGLALHRIGRQPQSPLKVREYLLRGIPTIIGYEDPDLADKPWFVLQLPNSENNIRDAVDDIRDFVLSVAGRRVGREEVRDRIDILVNGILGQPRYPVEAVPGLGSRPRGRSIGVVRSSSEAAEHLRSRLVPLVMRFWLPDGVPEVCADWPWCTDEEPVGS